MNRCAFAAASLIPSDVILQKKAVIQEQPSVVSAAAASAKPAAAASPAAAAPAAASASISHVRAHQDGKVRACCFSIVFCFFLTCDKRLSRYSLRRVRLLSKERLSPHWKRRLLSLKITPELGGANFVMSAINHPSPFLSHCSFSDVQGLIILLPQGESSYSVRACAVEACVCL